MANYYKKLHDYGDLMPVDEFIAACKMGAFIDYDGYGHAVKDGLYDPSRNIKPSYLKNIPDDATHIFWYNR